MFHVGQEVVAIKNGNFIKKNKTYVINDIKQGCEHYPTILDIGILCDGEENISYCDVCPFRISTGKVIWFSSKSFVPVDYTKAKKVTFEKITEQFPVIANCLLIFVFLCSFYVKKGYSQKDKLKVKGVVEKHLKSIINNPKNFDKKCSCPF
jgi:hypothetical protein